MRKNLANFLVLMLLVFIGAAIVANAADLIATSLEGPRSAITGMPILQHRHLAPNTEDPVNLIASEGGPICFCRPPLPCDCGDTRLSVIWRHAACDPLPPAKPTES